MKQGTFPLTYDHYSPARDGPLDVIAGTFAGVGRSSKYDCFWAIDLNHIQLSPEFRATRWWEADTRAGAIACARWHLRD